MSSSGKLFIKAQDKGIRRITSRQRSPRRGHLEAGQAARALLSPRPPPRPPRTTQPPGPAARRPQFPAQAPKALHQLHQRPSSAPHANLSPAVRGTSSDKSDRISLEGQPPGHPWRPSLSSGCQPPCRSPGPAASAKASAQPGLDPAGAEPWSCPAKQLHLGASVPITQPSWPQSSGPGCDRAMLYVKGSDRPPGPAS